jgi:hypothetical protein
MAVHTMICIHRADEWQKPHLNRCASIDGPTSSSKLLNTSSAPSGMPYVLATLDLLTTLPSYCVQRVTN